MTTKIHAAYLDGLADGRKEREEVRDALSAEVERAQAIAGLLRRAVRLLRAELALRDALAEQEAHREACMAWHVEKCTEHKAHRLAVVAACNAYDKLKAARRRGRIHMEPPVVHRKVTAETILAEHKGGRHE